MQMDTPESRWEIFGFNEDRDVLSARAVSNTASKGPYLQDRLTRKALMRTDLALGRLGDHEAEVFRAESIDGNSVDVALLSTGDELFALIGRARRHSSGLARLALVYSALARSHDAVVFTDVSGALLGASRSWRHLYGLRSHEVLGQNPRMVNSRQHSKAFFRDLWAQLSDKSLGSWSGELVNRKRGGGLVNVWQTITAFRGPTGSISGYLGITRELSRDQTLVHRLVSANLEIDRIARLNEAELATTLRARSSIEALQSSIALAQTSLATVEAAPAKARSCLEEAQDTLQGLDDLLTGLQETLKDRAEGPIGSMTRVSLQKLVRIETELQGTSAEARGISFNLKEQGTSFPCFLNSLTVVRGLRSVMTYVLEGSERDGSIEVELATDPKAGLHRISINFEPKMDTPGKLPPEAGRILERKPGETGNPDQAIRSAAAVFAAEGGSLESGQSSRLGSQITIQLPLGFNHFLERLWAVAVFDPHEIVWPLVSPTLADLGLPCFIAQTESELLNLCSHELPNLLLHPFEASIPGSCTSFPWPGATTLLHPAVCSLARTPDGGAVRAVAITAPAALSSQIEALFQPATPTSGLPQP